MITRRSSLPSSAGSNHFVIERKSPEVGNFNRIGHERHQFRARYAAILVQHREPRLDLVYPPEMLLQDVRWAVLTQLADRRRCDGRGVKCHVLRRLPTSAAEAAR